MSTNSIEIACPRCGQAHRVAGDKLPDAGELRCRSCGERIAFRVTPHGSTQPVRVTTRDRAFEAQRPEPKPPLRPLEDWLGEPEDPRQAATAAADAAFAPAAPALFPPRPDAEVCCPACGHRFDPQRAAPVRRTVLVVESADFFRHMATEVLGRRYAAVGVKSVAEARHVLATRQVDVVLTDLHLADGDARDVMNSLPRPLPVIVISGRDETHLFGDAWEELRRLGVRRSRSGPASPRRSRGSGRSRAAA